MRRAVTERPEHVGVVKPDLPGVHASCLAQVAGRVTPSECAGEGGGQGLSAGCVHTFAQECFVDNQKQENGRGSSTGWRGACGCEEELEVVTVVGEYAVVGGSDEEEDGAQEGEDLAGVKTTVTLSCLFPLIELALTAPQLQVKG